MQHSESEIKISIITATYNSAKTIADCIKSIASQTYTNIEHVIVDGLSKDNTLEIINQNNKRPGPLVSEKDKGIYDAMNKGIELCSGDIIGILNSDDFYQNEKIISKVVDAFKDDKIDCVYGDLVYVNELNTDKQVRYWKSGVFKKNSFLNGWMPPHPTFFVRKGIYIKYGSFNLNLRSAADYELMLRLMHRHELKAFYIPEVLVKMRVGGQSNKSLLNRLKANLEDREAWRINGIRPRFYTLFLKPLSKVFQFIK